MKGHIYKIDKINEEKVKKYFNYTVHVLKRTGKLI